MPEAAVGARPEAVSDAGATPGATPVLALGGVVKSWASQDTPVLDGVTLELAPGSTAAISGRNGAGKTTLLRIAGGLIEPEHGTVRVDGIDPARDRTEFQRRIGFLAAGNSGLYARLRVEHHLDLWTRIALMPRRERSSPVVQYSHGRRSDGARACLRLS